MALKIQLEVERAARGEHWDRYYAQEGEWFFEIRMPKDEKITTLDVHFEFDGDKEK